MCVCMNIYRNQAENQPDRFRHHFGPGMYESITYI